MATVLALGLLALGGCSSSVPASPATTPSAAPGLQPTPADCSALPADAGMVADLPASPVRLTLCNEPDHALPGLVVPPDALVDGVDTVLKTLVGLETPTPIQACTAELGPAYRLVVEGADGTVSTLRGELYGCRMAGDRIGADRLLDAFAEALRAQRVDLPVPIADPLADAACPPGGSWLRPDVADTVGGYACVGADGQGSRVELTDEQWTTLRDDLVASSRPLSPAETWPVCEEPPGPTLVGVAATGESLVLTGSCGRFLWDRAEPYEPAEEQGLWLWEPGTAATALLETLA